MSALDRSTPPAPGELRPFAVPRVERAALGNGVTVLGARHGRMPVVTAALIVEGGAAGEPPERAGIAHLTARALETGTARRSGDELAFDLERLGVEFAAEATWDAALLSMTVPSERLEPALSLFAEIVRAPAFPVQEVERLRDQQLADILQRRTEPRALAAEAASRFIFAPGVPYGRPLNGVTSTVETLDAAAVRSFYERHYTPAPATLVLVGDVDRERALELAERHFGDWRGERVEVTSPEVRPGVDTTTVFIVDRPGSVQSELRLGHVGVERTHPDHYPLLVMNALFGGAFTSRLNLSLRERHGYTYGVHSRFAGRRAPGPFIIQTAVATDVTAPAIEETLREIEALRRDGATESEVVAARDYVAGILPLQFQTTEQFAGRLADVAIYGLPDDYYEHHRSRIQAVSPEEVHRVAREHLHPEALAVVVVGAAAEVEPPLRALGIGQVRVYRSDLTA